MPYNTKATLWPIPLECINLIALAVAAQKSLVPILGTRRYNDHPQPSLTRLLEINSQSIHETEQETYTQPL